MIMKKERRRKSIIYTTVMIQSQKLSLRAVMIPILMVMMVMTVMTLRKVLMMMGVLKVVQISLLFILKNGDNNSFVPHCF